MKIFYGKNCGKHVQPFDLTRNSSLREHPLLVLAVHDGGDGGSGAQVSTSAFSRIMKKQRKSIGKPLDLRRSVRTLGNLRRLRPAWRRAAGGRSTATTIPQGGAGRGRILWRGGLQGRERGVCGGHRQGRAKGR